MCFVALLGLISYGQYFVAPQNQFWVAFAASPDTAAADSDGEETEKDPWEPYYLVDAEAVYYDQPERLAQSFDGLLAHRPGVADLYFVGFGSYAYQDVFMREVFGIRALFDQELDTTGRSAALVNNLQTLDRLPLANATNLGRTLEAVADRIDLDEDVVFLYLTSHGSEDHWLSVDFWPLNLNNLSAQHLRTLLDNSGIKWRVVVVSACYSGGFIAPLKTDHSLIMTAARADRTSFGCAQENEYTYFGQAYFDEALRGGHTFLNAFDIALESISRRESAENLTPSEPQIFVGDKMREKLAELELRLRRAPQAASSAE